LTAEYAARRAATAGTARGPRRLARAIGIRRVRLATGLVMFTYLLTHYTNHALGNISLAAMNAGLEYHVRLWQSWPGTLALYAALTIHAALGLWALYQRRDFRFRASEAIQLIFGLSIPLLLAQHVVAERLGLALYGIDRGYPQALYAFWVAAPTRGVVQGIALLVAWTHACIGLYFSLRLRRWFPRAAPALFAAAILLPTLALLGYYQGGRAVVALSAVPEWRADNLTPGQVGTPAQNDGIVHIRELILYGWGAAIVLVLLARGLRALAERRHGLVRITYPDGRSVRIPLGFSVLEASWRFSIPHACVCGGRGRCSTCRIRIVGDRGGLPEPSPREISVLERAGYGNDAAVRLACQLRPKTDVVVVPLLPPNADASYAVGNRHPHTGEERHIVSMFVDMRGSTKMAEGRMPFDTVFIINRFIGAVSQAVIEAGGEPNQFLGDGMLALFGLEARPATASRQALRAASLIARNVEQLNRQFAEELSEPIRFGIGIHGGEVIVGDIGYREHVVFTALGDAVNVTARLQEMTKALDCEVVFSDEVRKSAGLSADEMPTVEVPIRGRVEPLLVRTARAADMLATPSDAAAPALSAAPLL
jgi:adenylate cyclase